MDKNSRRPDLVCKGGYLVIIFRDLISKEMNKVKIF